MVATKLSQNSLNYLIQIHDNLFSLLHHHDIGEDHLLGKFVKDAIKQANINAVL